MTSTDFDFVCVGFAVDLMISWIANVAFSFYHTFGR